MPINPFEFLENAGSHTNTWISIYGPLGLGLILAGVAAIVIKIRRNRERRELEVAFREVSAAATEEIATEVPKGPAIGIGARFRAGLGRTREFFESGAKSIFSGRIEINGPVLEKLHEILYRADIGVKTVDRLIDGAAGAARANAQSLGSVVPELAILISCVGRKLVLKQRVEEEVEAVSEILGAGAMLAGFYSYGEISPFTPGAKCELHNQTMTITTLSER